MRTLSVFFCFFLLLFSSCGFKASEVTPGDSINPEARLAITKLITGIHNSLRQQDPEYVIGLLSEGLKQRMPNYREEVTGIMKQIQLDSVNFLRNVVLEYSVKNSIFSRVGQVRSDQNRFSFTFPTRPWSYIYLFSVASATPGEKYLISNVFTQEKGKWKLDCFYVGSYSLNDRNADDLYSEASGYFYGNRLLPAYVRSYMMVQILDPAATYMRYDIRDGMTELHTDITKALQERIRFPTVLEEIPGRPELFDLRAKIVSRKVYPLVLYKTSIPLKDEAGIFRENKQIHRVIASYLPGIRWEFDSVYYAAVNEYPNDYKQVDWTAIARTSDSSIEY